MWLWTVERCDGQHDPDCGGEPYDSADDARAAATELGAEYEAAELEYDAGAMAMLWPQGGYR